jgi:hypothetical protein
MPLNDRPLRRNLGFGSVSANPRYARQTLPSAYDAIGAELALVTALLPPFFDYSQAVEVLPPSPALCASHAPNSSAPSTFERALLLARFTPA